MFQHVKVQLKTSPKNTWNKINLYKNIANYKGQNNNESFWQYDRWKKNPQKHFNKQSTFIENQIRIIRSMKKMKISNNKKLPIVFDTKIADWVSLCKRKLNILLVFTVQSYIKVLKFIKLHSTCSFFLEISNKESVNKFYMVIVKMLIVNIFQ